MSNPETTSLPGTIYSAANGSSHNGCTIGSGYDCQILVTGQSVDGDTLAIACITSVATQSEWMIELRSPAGADLQRSAVLLASAPPFDDPDLVADDSEEWEPLARRWDAARRAEVRS